MVDNFKAGKAAAAETLPSASGLPAEGHGVEQGVEMGILSHLPSNGPSLLEQLRSQGGQPGGVPLGSPSKKDCGFSRKDRCELTLQRPVPLGLSLAFELKAHFSRKPQQSLTQREDYGLALTAQAGLLYQAVSSGAPRQLVRPAHSLPKNVAAFSFSGCWCNGSPGLIQVPTPSFSGVLPSNNPPSFPILFKGLRLRGQS